MAGLFLRAFAAAGVLSSSAFLFAQQAPPQQQQQAPPPSQQAPVFRGGVELVALDVTVVDRDGMPVTGLKPEDFVVTLSGQVRPVRTFDYATFGAAPASEAASAAPAREVTNDISRAATTSRGGRIVIVLIDDLAAKPGQGKSLTIAAERMLNTLDLGDLVGLATTSGQGPVVTPTRDRAALLAALKSKGVVGRNENVTAPFYLSELEGLSAFGSVTGMPGSLGAAIGRECAILELGDACAEMVKGAAKRLYSDVLHRTSSQLVAYRTIITALKAAPPPRVIIALTPGLLPNYDGTFDLKQVSRAAAEAGVQFYALTEAVNDVDAGDINGYRAEARREEAFALTSGVHELAIAAGGEAFTVIGQADRFFKRIIAETSGVYRLGVDAPTSIKRDRFIDAKVKVNRPGVTVRSNRHALVRSEAAEAVPIDDALRARLAQGGVAYGVPIALATALRRERAGDRVELGVNALMPANAPGPLTTMFTLVNEAGQAVQAGKKIATQTTATEDYRVALGIPIAPGAYRLRVAVADAAGNIGSVETSLDATLKKFGRFAVSELFLTWSGADATPRFLALETLPADATTLRVGLELYPDDGAAEAEVSVRFELVLAGATSAVLGQEAPAVRDGTLLSAGVDAPTKDLAAGVYTVKATVLEAGREIGVVTTVIRKAR
ncbi:MAG TPA: VWA domain-containing protein [Vicinamibacterales bacterium]|nr:VWA domain-containing protein [Vicinamibacterales bacterium]